MNDVPSMPPNSESTYLNTVPATTLQIWRRADIIETDLAGLLHSESHAVPVQLDPNKPIWQKATVAQQSTDRSHPDVSN